MQVQRIGTRRPGEDAGVAAAITSPQQMHNPQLWADTVGGELRPRGPAQTVLQVRETCAHCGFCIVHLGNLFVNLLPISTGSCLISWYFGGIFGTKRVWTCPFPTLGQEARA